MTMDVCRWCGGTIELDVDDWWVHVGRVPDDGHAAQPTDLRARELAALDGQCPALVLIERDGWGRARQRCELDTDHGGPHRVDLDTCDPPAWLAWNT